MPQIQSLKVSFFSHLLLVFSECFGEQLLQMITRCICKNIHTVSIKYSLRIILRIFKFIRYSGKMQVLGRVIRKEKGVLLSVLAIAVFYVFLTALIMFNAEPHVNPVTGATVFEDFFDALYWATVTLTTVGYGDMVPVTDIGRFVSMLSSIFGVAIIALPSGVMTASYLEEIKEEKKKARLRLDPGRKEGQAAGKDEHGNVQDTVIETGGEGAS